MWGEQAAQAAQALRAQHRQQRFKRRNANKRRKRHKWHKRQQQCKGRSKANCSAVSEESGTGDNDVGRSDASGLGDMQSTQADTVA